MVATKVLLRGVAWLCVALACGCALPPAPGTLFRAPEGDASWPDVTADEPTPSLVPTNYATSFVEERGCRVTVEHSATTPGLVVSHIRVLTSPEAAAPYRANAARLPVGALVLKEEYANASCSRLRAWTVMRKEPAGYDAAHNDWRWQRVRAADRAVLVDGRVASCISCHDTPRAPCTARDWQRTVP